MGLAGLAGLPGLSGIVPGVAVVPPEGLDPDVSAYLSAASLSGEPVTAAINTLVTTLKTQSIWAKCLALYPFPGGTAGANAVNLRTPGTYNLSFTNVNHVGGMQTAGGQRSGATSGLVPNGSPLGFSNIHLSFSAVEDSRRIDMGFNQSETGRILLASRFTIISPDEYLIDISSVATGRLRGASLGGNGHHLLTNSAGYRAYWREGAVVNSSTASINSGTSTLDIGIGARTSAFGTLATESGPTTAQQDAKTYTFASVGYGLTPSEILAFYNAVQAYQTAMGR